MAGAAGRSSCSPGKGANGADKVNLTEQIVHLFDINRAPEARQPWSVQQRRILQHAHGEQHIVGCDWPAVVPELIRLQVEDIGLVVHHLPALGQVRHHAPVLVDARQPAINEGTQVTVHRVSLAPDGAQKLGRAGYAFAKNSAPGRHQHRRDAKVDWASKASRMVMPPNAKITSHGRCRASDSAGEVSSSWGSSGEMGGSCMGTNQTAGLDAPGCRRRQSNVAKQSMERDYITTTVIKHSNRKRPVSRKEIWNKVFSMPRRLR